MALATAKPEVPLISNEIIPTNIRSAAGVLSDKIKQTSWKVVLRFRNLIYFLIYAAIGLGMAYSISMRDRLDLNVDADSLKSVRLYISTPKETLQSAKTEFRINVSTHGGTELISKTVNFEAPKELFQ